MFDHSVIKRTGQWWKAMVASALVLAGGLSMLYGKFFTATNRAFAGLVILGAFVGLLGLAFAAVAIRCPKCGARWVWRAVSGQGAGEWLAWLLSQPTCPACKDAGGGHAA